MASFMFAQQKLAYLAATANCSGRQPVVRPSVTSLSPGLQVVAKRPVLSGAAHMHPRTSFGSTWLEGADLSEKPSAAADVIFYTHTLCPYAHRVHLCLLEKGVDFDLVHIDLSSKPVWFQRISHLVPVVEHRGSLHTESLQICRWVEEEFDGSNSAFASLLPKDESQRNRALYMVETGADAFAHAGLGLLAGNGRSWGISTSHTSAQRRRFQAELETLSGYLNESGGPFLLGADVSLADIVYFPFAERFRTACPEFCDLDLHTACGGAVGRWLDAMHSRPATRATSPNHNQFLSAMKRHRSLDFFDYASYSSAQLFH